MRTEKKQAPQQSNKSTPSGIRDVAQLANVSRMTVSRALNNPEKVSSETLQRVQAAVKTTGYVPNLVAGSFRSARTRSVALIVPHYWEHFAETIQVISETFSGTGYQVLVGQTSYSLENETELLRAFIGRRPDGIIVTGVQHSPEIRELLIKSRIPVVEIWDITDDPIDFVIGFKHEELSSAVCKFLFELGRKKIAVICATDVRAIRRNNAFLATAKDLGLTQPVIMQMPFPLNHISGRLAFAELVDSFPKVDAVYCCNDFVAMGVMTEAKARGIRIPEDLCVIGTGDLDFSASIIPSLTSVKVDVPLMGKKAAGFILDRLEDRPIKDKIVEVTFSIIRRQST